MTPGADRPGSVDGRNPTRRPTSTTQRRTETVDARDPNAAAERTIAQWFDPDKSSGGTQSGPPVADHIRDAVRSADRSIEQQRVPSRHEDLVRRVFDRYLRRAQGAQGEQSGPSFAPAAKDADTPKNP